jgi:hypothetical protein
MLCVAERVWKNQRLQEIYRDKKREPHTKPRIGEMAFSCFDEKGR